MIFEDVRFIITILDRLICPLDVGEYAASKAVHVIFTVQFCP